MELNVWMTGGEHLWIIEGWEQENEYSSASWGVLRKAWIYHKSNLYSIVSQYQVTSYETSIFVNLMSSKKKSNCIALD